MTTTLTQSYPEQALNEILGGSIKWQLAKANDDGNWGEWKPWPAERFANGTIIPLGFKDGGYMKWRMVPSSPDKDFKGA